MSQTENNYTSILDMANGAIKERVNYELSKIIDNISDPNTNPTKTRTLTVQIKIVPDSERCNLRVETTVKSKLEPTNSISTPLYLTEDGESNKIAIEMTPQIPGQIDMSGDEQPQPKKIKIVNSQAV